MNAATVTGSRTGVGTAPAHHGELLQGVITDSGRPTSALVTLPVALEGARATFSAVAGDGPVVVHPADKVHARHAAERLLHHLRREHGAPAVTGVLRVHSTLPVGIGMGSSSADVLASLRAVADALQSLPGPDALCEHAASVEGACDPLGHLPEVVLFAQREGRVVEHLGPSLPPLVVLSCETGGGRPVETLSCPPPLAGHAATYDDLRARLRGALRTGDTAEVGAVATASAELNQERLPKAELPRLVTACREHGGIGVQVAHSGNVAGVLLEGTASDRADDLLRCAARLGRDGVHVRGWYDVATGG